MGNDFMKQHFDITLGLTVREYETAGKLPFLKFQIGETRNVQRSEPPNGKTLPVGYNLTVLVFHVRAFGKTFAEAKRKLSVKI